MFAKKAIRIYVRGCRNTVAGRKTAQTIDQGRCVNSEMAKATFGGCLPVRNYQGHGGGLTEIETQGSRYRDGQQAYGAAAVYFEDFKR